MPTRAHLVEVAAVVVAVFMLQIARVPTLSDLHLGKIPAFVPKASEPPSPATSETAGGIVRAAPSGSDPELDRIYELSDSGRHAAAVSAAEDRVTARREEGPSGKKGLSLDLQMLGQVLRASGKLEGARKAMLEAYKLRETEYGSGHLAVAQSLEELGDLDFDQKETTSAADAYNRTLAILRQELPDSPRIGRLEARLKAIGNTAGGTGGRGPGPATGGKSGGRLAPKGPPSDLWAVYPMPFPKEILTDGHAWRVMTDVLALGLATALGKKCVDPWEAEQRVTDRVTPDRDGRQPGPPDFQKIQKSLRIGHAIVPALVAGKQGYVLELRVADGADGSPMEIATAVVSVSIPAREPVTASIRMLEAAGELLKKLGLRAQAGPAEPASETTPPVPVLLLARLQERARALAARPSDAGGLVALSRDYSTLGFQLTLGAAAAGPRLLIRGAALSALARLLAPESRAARRAHAFAQLLANHAAAAYAAVEPLLGQRDPEAEALAASCKAEKERLLAMPGGALLLRAIFGRSGDMGVLGEVVPGLLQRGLPIAYAIAGSRGKIPVGQAKLYTALWLATEEASPQPAVDAALRKAIEEDAASVWGARLLQRRAKLLSRPQARAATATTLIGLELTPARAWRVRRELFVMPAVEYAVFAMTMWGVVDEARAMLEAVRTVVPDSQILAGKMAAFRATDPTGTLASWPEDWTPEDSADPSKTRPEVVEWNRHWGPKVGHPARWCWDLGAASGRVVADQFYESLAAAGNDPEMAAGTLAVLADNDPWNQWLASSQIDFLATLGDSGELKRALERSASRLPGSEKIPAAGARALLAQANAKSAMRIFRETVKRFPDRTAVRVQLVERLCDGDHLGEAAKAVVELAGLRGDPLELVAAASRVGERLLDVRAMEPARRMVAIAGRADAWKAETLMLAGRQLILDGKTQEGLGTFEKLEERYGTGGASLPAAVRALLDAGEEDEAARVAESIAPELQQRPGILMQLAFSFLAGGDHARMNGYLSRIRQIAPRSYLKTHELLQVSSQQLGSPGATKDPAQLRAWVEQVAKLNSTGLADSIFRNPAPEATGALIDGVLDLSTGRHIAVRLAMRAELDLDIPVKCDETDLRRARDALAAWWSGAKAGYAEARLR